MDRAMLIYSTSAYYSLSAKIRTKWIIEYFSYLALVEYRTKWIRIKRGPGVRSIQAIICYQSWGSNFYHWVWLCQCVMYFGHQWKEFWSVRWEWMIWYQMHSRDQWGRDPSNARMWKNIGIIGKFLKNW